MTNPPRRDGWDEEHPGTYSYPADPDEARGYQGGYQPTYHAPPGPDPTQQLPAYSPYGYDPYASAQYGGPPNPPGGTPPEPREPRGSGPRWWLWALASAAFLLVVGLVIGLVVVDTSQQETLVAPGSPLEPTMTMPSTRPSTTTRKPTTTRTTTSAPTPTSAPPGQTSPSGTQTVVYEVAGNGRALSVIYLDTGGVLQTEFNVTLPWTKEVELTGQAENSATVSVVNVSNQVTCSITVNGEERDQKTGTGLTLCTALGSR